MLTPRALFQNLCQCPMHGVALFCFKGHVMKVVLPLQYSLLPPRPPLRMLNHLQLYLSTYFTNAYTYPPHTHPIPLSVSCSFIPPLPPPPSTSEELLSITVRARPRSHRVFV